jgi:signal transduction histidine kinase
MSSWLIFLSVSGVFILRRFHLALTRQPGAGGFYHELFEHCPDAIFVAEKLPAQPFRFLSLNPVARRILAAPGVALAGRALDEIANDAADENYRRMMLGLLARLERIPVTGLPERYEGAFGAGDEVFGITLFALAGKVGTVRVLGFARDIAPQKLYERELHNRAKLEERLSGFAATAPGFFYSYRHGLDGSNTMPFASAGIGELFGLEPMDVAGSIAPLNLLTHREDMSRVIESIARSAADMAPMNIEFRTRHPAKGELWIESRAIPLAHDDGSITWHGFMHDVTGRKLMEQRLQETQDKLRELANSREQLREDERRRVAWEMHEELGQMLVAIKWRLGSLAAGLPHELQAENNTITGMLDESIRTVRSIVSEVRPTVLLQGAAAALEWLVTDFNRQTDLNCELVCNEQEGYEADEELTTLVFRIAQEALENVAGQNVSRGVKVRWNCGREGYFLALQHDGDAFAENVSDKARSLSLFGMEERVRAFGGEIRCFTNGERGSTLEVCFNIKP